MKIFYFLAALVASALCQNQPPWQPFPGRVSHLSAKGTEVWATTDSSSVMRLFSGSAWAFVNGGGQYVAAATDGRAWVLRNDLFSENIYRYNPSSDTFTHINGTLRQISAADGDNAVGVNYLGDIFQYQNNAWTQLPGKAMQVSMGIDHAIFAIDVNNNLVQLVGGQWNQLESQMIYVDAHTTDRYVFVGYDNFVYVSDAVDGFNYYYWPMSYTRNCVEASITQDKVYCQDNDGALYVTDYYSYGLDFWYD